MFRGCIGGCNVLARTVIHGVVAALRERAALRKMEQVGRRSANGVEFGSFCVKSGNGFLKGLSVGMARFVKKVFGFRRFHDLAGIHHHCAVAKARNHTEIVADENNGHAEFGAHFFHQFENLRLDGHIKCRGRFVGDDEVGFGNQGHGDHDALTHSAGEFVRIHSHALFRVGNSHVGEHGQGAFAGVGAADFFVDQQRFHQLLFDTQERIQASHRVLENHRDAAAAKLVELPVRNGEQIDAVENGLAAFDACGRLREKSHDGVGGDGFSGPGFADNSQRFAAIDLKGDIPRGAHDPCASVEGDAEVIDA